MALQNKIVLSNGTIVADAYIKIRTFEGDKNIINFNVCVYLSKLHEESGLQWLSEEDYSFVPSLNSDKNFISQAYDYIKNMPNFIDAIDC